MASRSNHRREQRGHGPVRDDAGQVVLPIGDRDGQGERGNGAGGRQDVCPGCRRVQERPEVSEREFDQRTERGSLQAQGGQAITSPTKLRVRALGGIRSRQWAGRIVLEDIATRMRRQPDGLISWGDAMRKPIRRSGLLVVGLLLAGAIAAPSSAVAWSGVDPVPWTP